MRLTKDVEIHYSPDDGGWYLQDYSNRKVSDDIYDTCQDAKEAFENGTVVWID